MYDQHQDTCYITHVPLSITDLTFTVDMHSAGFPSLNIILSLSAYSHISVVHYLCFCCSLSLQTLLYLGAVLPACAVWNRVFCRCLIICYFLFQMHTSYISILYLKIYSVHYSKRVSFQLCKRNCWSVVSTACRYNVQIT